MVDTEEKRHKNWHPPIIKIWEMRNSKADQVTTEARREPRKKLFKKWPMLLASHMRFKLRVNCRVRNVEVIESSCRASGWSGGDECLIGMGSGGVGRGPGHHEKNRAFPGVLL